MKKCPICGKDVPPRYGEREKVYGLLACAAGWRVLAVPSSPEE